MDSFSNTSNLFKILNFVTIRVLPTPDPLRGARDGPKVAGASPPPEKILATTEGSWLLFKYFSDENLENGLLMNKFVFHSFSLFNMSF